MRKTAVEERKRVELCLCNIPHIFLTISLLIFHNLLEGSRRKVFSIFLVPWIPVDPVTSCRSITRARNDAGPAPPIDVVMAQRSTQQCYSYYVLQAARDLVDTFTHSECNHVLYAFLRGDQDTAIDGRFLLESFPCLVYMY